MINNNGRSAAHAGRMIILYLAVSLQDFFHMKAWSNAQLAFHLYHWKPFYRAVLRPKSRRA
ncbi:MAG: hypothetical protein H7831_04295 [Magnetococcus sp. WYHC-3]